MAKFDKDGNESSISYQIKLYVSARSMASSLSNLVDNLAEGIHNIKFKDCNYFLEYESFSGNLIKYECLSCDKNYSNKIDDKLKNKFQTTFKFSNNDINYFILLLRKSIYTYEYMDDSEYFNETTLPAKKIIFYLLKCGGYYRCKSHRCKKSLERLRNKKIR